MHINIRIDIKMNIDIHIIVNMNIEHYIIHYLLFIIYSLLPIGFRHNMDFRHLLYVLQVQEQASFDVESLTKSFKEFAGKVESQVAKNAKS